MGKNETQPNEEPKLFEWVNGYPYLILDEFGFVWIPRSLAKSLLSNCPNRPLPEEPDEEIEEAE